MRPNYRLMSLLLGSLLFAACQSQHVNHTMADRPSAQKKAAELNMQLGLNYFERGDYPLALEKLEKSIAQDPRLASAQMMIAMLYNQLGEFKLAEQHYLRAISLAPNYSQAHNNFGIYLCQQGRYQQSIQSFLRAVQNPLYQQAALAYENAGLCAMKIPDLAKAEKYLTKALQIEPVMSKSLLAMAEVNSLQGQYRFASQYIERYRRDHSWTARALMIAIQVAKGLNDKNALASYLVLLRGRFPDSEQNRQVQRGDY